MSYRTGTRFNSQEKLTHVTEDKENDGQIERAGIFAHDTLINVQNGEQHAVAVQPQTKVKSQKNKKKSFFGWKKEAEEKIEENDHALKEHLMSK